MPIAVTFMTIATIVGFALYLTAPLKRWLISQAHKTSRSARRQRSAPLLVTELHQPRLSELFGLFRLINQMVEAGTMSDRTQNEAEMWLTRSQYSGKLDDMRRRAFRLMLHALNEPEAEAMPMFERLRATKWARSHAEARYGLDPTEAAG